MEPETFKKTVVPLREKLLVYTRKLAGDQVEAEDLVQEVLLKLWSIRGKLDGYQSVEALALKVTKNKALDELKRPGNDYLDIESISRPDTAANPGMLIEQKEAATFIKQTGGFI